MIEKGENTRNLLTSCAVCDRKNDKAFHNNRCGYVLHEVLSVGRQTEQQGRFRREYQDYDPLGSAVQFKKTRVCISFLRSYYHSVFLVTLLIDLYLANTNLQLFCGFPLFGLWLVRIKRLVSLRHLARAADDAIGYMNI
uniref:Uncharacterized protein n=1 Tax=Glossina pallidipes TaxID=7398 RepID=A0A1B0A7M3_GLOPL